MSTLSNLKKLSSLRHQIHSEETLAALKGKALDCMVEMHKHGVTVRKITIMREHVTIDIDQPDQWLRGSIHITRVNGGRREIVMVTSVLGCQVQWVKEEEHPFLQNPRKA